MILPHHFHPLLSFLVEIHATIGNLPEMTQRKILLGLLLGNSGPNYHNKAISTTTLIPFPTWHGGQRWATEPLWHIYMYICHIYMSDHEAPS